MFQRILQMNRDLVFSMISLIISSILLLIAFSYPRDSSMFPRVICITMVALSAVMLLQALRTKHKNFEILKDSIHCFNKTSLLFLCLSIAYIWCLVNIGFYVSSYCFVVCVCLLFGYKNKIVIIIWPAILGLLLYLSFTCFLNVPTPAGILF